MFSSSQLQVYLLCIHHHKAPAHNRGVTVSQWLTNVCLLAVLSLSTTALHEQHYYVPVMKCCPKICKAVWLQCGGHVGRRGKRDYCMCSFFKFHIVSLQLAFKMMQHEAATCPNMVCALSFLTNTKTSCIFQTFKNQIKTSQIIRNSSK